MAQEIFAKVRQVIQDIEQAAPKTKEEIEQFRLTYLGTKNILKPLMGEIRNIANELKKDFGQLVNEAKQAAEAKFEQLQETLEASDSGAAAADIDLTAPAEPIELGSRHPIATTMERIIRIFERIGFVVADDREIEDDWHNFTAMNTPEDHPARDMQDTYYLKNSAELLLRTHTSSVQARVMTHQKP
ncbi:MAG TPA: phenylalanine--tRNA ligase subunit alpha, partial [Saprospiraceae bacterium]|nr:phenylalanine--tRNA ligase subunit alpha [Saprospiraceae bacterium]